MHGLLPILAVAALLGWAALVPGHLRRHPAERGPFAAVLGTVLVAWLALAVVGPAGLPRDALLMLREGREASVLRMVLTPEPVFRDWVASAWHLPIRTSVAIHLAEAVLAAGLLALIGWRRGGLPVAAAVTGTFLASAWFVHAAVSPGPETTVILGALLPAHAWVMRGASRWLPIGVLVASAVVVASLRLETLLVALPALALALAPPSWPRLDATFERLPSWARVLLAVLAGEIALAGLGLAFAGSGVTRGLAEPAMLPWGARHLATFRWPLDLFALAPPGFAVLAITGFVAASVRSPRACAAAAAVLLLERVYVVEEHLGDAPYETLRHHAMSVGLVALLAVAGAEVLLRRAGPRAPALAAVLLATAFLPRPLSPEGVPEVFWRRIETTQTVGTRFVVEVTEAFSRCVVVTQLAPTVLTRDGDQDGWTYDFELHAYGVPLLPGTETPVMSDARQRLAARGLLEETPLALPAGWPGELAHIPCIVWLHGLDCNLHGAGCEAFGAGLEPVVDARVLVREHNTHHGGHARPLRLAAWYVGRR